MAHVEDAEFAAWLVGEEDQVTLEHLDSCDACRREAVDFRRALGAFRDALRNAAEERRIAWAPPAQAVAGTARRWLSAEAFLRWAPRAALAASVLAAALVMRSPRPAAPPASTDAADNALLLEIDADLSRQAPAALAPAETLVAQMSSNQSQSSDSKAEE